MSHDEPTTAKGASTEVELTRTQQTVARRMAESRATIPDFSLQIDVDMEAAVALHETLKQQATAEPDHPAGEQPTPTYNDMIVKAVALALREHPRANSSYRDGRVQIHSRINVGVAVAVGDDDLVVPTVFDADEKSLSEIAADTRRLIAAARDGSIAPPELGGATFTVSNLGMCGARSFTAVINPPQAAILTVGAIEPRAVARDGAAVVRRTTTLTLACDHRVLFGVTATHVLIRARDLLETPTTISS